MIYVVERLLPGFVQRLYESGVERELLVRSLNGMAIAGSALAVAMILILVFRKRICAILSRVEGPRFFTAVLAVLSVMSLPDPVVRCCGVWRNQNET